MAGNPSKRGKRGQIQLPAGRDYEVDFFVREAGLTRERATELVQKHGGDREKIMRALGKGKL